MTLFKLSLAQNIDVGYVSTYVQYPNVIAGYELSLNPMLFSCGIHTFHNSARDMVRI